MVNFSEQGYIQLIKSDSKEMNNVTKDSCFKGISIKEFILYMH